MSNFNSKLEKMLYPIAGRISASKPLLAIRDGIALAMPLMLIGSLFMVVATLPLPGWEEWLTEKGFIGYLWKGVNSTFGLMGLIASFGIAYGFAKQSKVEGLAAGIISLSAFILVTPFTTSAEMGLPILFLGGKGLFTAIIMGLSNGFIYQWLIHKKVQIRLPNDVPPVVSLSLSALIPGTIILILWLIVFALLDHFNLPNLHRIAEMLVEKPFGLLGSNIFGTLIVVGLNSIFWFVGLHGGNVVNSIMQPIWIANLNENVLAYQSSQELKNVVTVAFIDNFVYIGGGGAVVGLVLALLYLANRKYSSKQVKELAPVTFIPSLFNINEPTMFGLPVVLNGIIFAPLLLVPMVNALVTYSVMSLGLVPFTKAATPWTTPPIISGFLTTGSISGSILQIILILIDFLLYLPFVLAIDSRLKGQS